MTLRSGTRPEPSSTLAAFADLICQDDELLQAEFADLVAAEWSCPGPPFTATVRSSTESVAL